LTCVAVPEGLGIKLAERSDRKFYAKGNVRSKQLFDVLFYFLPIIIYILSNSTRIEM